MIQNLDSIYIQWHTDLNGQKYSIKRLGEAYTVAGNKIILNEIPDIQSGITIAGMEESERIAKQNDFKVDYTSGVINFDKSKEGKIIIIDSYYARGVVMYPASRIYYILDGVLTTVEEQMKAMQIQLNNLL